jgi:hypothetical protein
MSGQPKSLGDGVVRINGREVLRIPPGDPPVQVHPFDADLTAFAGQHILLEFAVDGEVHGFSPANWYRPEIVVTRNLVGIGQPRAENGWDTTSAVRVRASSQHATYVAANVINGSGLTADGLRHGNTGLFISGPLADSQANPRGGTMAGGHWIEFTFDRVYELEELWIWNYNGNAESYNYKVQGFQNVTIQSSPTGSMDPGDWTTIFTGPVPMSDSTAPTNFETGVSLKIDCGGVPARYVVITTAAAPDHNWSEGQYGDAGLSEVRFLVRP